jgi:glycosyltransferase involved in cell wall biosynthesis
MVYSLAGGGPLKETLVSSGVKVVLAPVSRDGRPAAFAQRIFRFALASGYLFSVMLRTRPSIVHCFLPAAYLTAAPLAILAGIRVRIMSRRSLNRYQAKSRFLSKIERSLHRYMTAVLGNSRSVVSELAAEGVPPERLGLIYNGVDATQFGSGVSRAVMRQSLGLAENDLVFVIVANLIPYKGHVDLVEALSMASSSIPSQWKLLIVGRDDGVGPSLRRRAAELGIEDRLLFLGSRLDIADLLKASDIGFLTSHEEGFSNAIVEGMFAGLPMIVTDVGGNGEAVINGVTGFVGPPHAPQDLSDAIARLAADPDLRVRYGESGRRRAETAFTLDACVARYERLYRGLLDGELPGDMEELRIQ